MNKVIACCVKLGIKPLNVKRTLQAIENLTYNHDNIYLNFLMSEDSSIRRIFNDWEEENRKSFDVIDTHYRKEPYIKMNVLVKHLPKEIINKVLFLYDYKPVPYDIIEKFLKHRAKVIGIYNGQNIWNYNLENKRYFQDPKYDEKWLGRVNADVAGISDWLMINYEIFRENKDYMTMSFKSNALHENFDLLNFCKKWKYPSKKLNKKHYLLCDFKSHNI